MVLNIETITEIFTMAKSYMKPSDIENLALEYLEYLNAHGYDIHNLIDEDPDLDRAIKKIDEYMKEETDCIDEDPYQDDEDYDY